MGGILGHPIVVHQVLCRHDGQLMVVYEAHPEYGLVILLAALPMLLAHVEEILAVLAFLPKAARLLHAVLVVEEGVLAVPLVDDTPPRGPAPDGKHRGEEIIVGHILGHLVAVESGNHANALIVLVAVEQLLAEREERLRRNVIVFQYDTFLHMTEGPFLGKVFRRIAAEVLLLI